MKTKVKIVHCTKDDGCGVASVHEFDSVAEAEAFRDQYNLYNPRGYMPYPYRYATTETKEELPCLKSTSN